MTAESVCAVVVTYHPSAKMVENLNKVLAQVQGLVVVDNGSSVDELNMLREASQALGFRLIENGTNLGIAEALNQGVRWTKTNSYPWVILFDQDSTITDSFIRQMFAAWESHPDRDRVGSMHPRYVDPETRVEAPVPRASDYSPVLPMTSGSLMPAWITDRVGWFASEYFIDLVDWEYSFRIRGAGYLVADARQAALFHAPGAPTKSTILGHTFYSGNYGAVRYYYISRNCIPFCRKYVFSFPKWVLNGVYIQLRDTMMGLIAGKDRVHKLRNLLLGIWDGVTGRMGKREGL